MKWIRWDGSSHFDTRNDKPVSMIDENYSDTFTDHDIVCEKDVIWREIESGTLNTEDGKLHITLKPLPTPEKVPTLVEAAKHYLETGWQAYRNDGLRGLQSLKHSTDICKCAVQLAEAIEREEKKPTPSLSEYQHIPVELARVLKSVAGKVTCLTIQDDGSWSVRQCEDGKEVFRIYTFGDVIQSYTMCDKRIGSPLPANPYTKEAVDEFIDAISKCSRWINDSQPGAYWSHEGRSAMDKLQVILRQREAANVQ